MANRDLPECKPKAGGGKLVLDMQNKHNQGRDRNLVSDEPYEIEYIHQQFPNHSHEEIHRAVQAAKAELKGSESRDRIMQILRQKLK